jgi:tRNA-splicing ligase RtcB
METQITSDELTALGVTTPEAQTAFARVANGLISNAVHPKEKVLTLFAQLLDNPKRFSHSKNKLTNLARFVQAQAEAGIPLAPTEYAQQLIAQETVREAERELAFELPSRPSQRPGTYDLRPEPLGYPIYGPEHIEAGALGQMETAMRLPIAVAGALMPDAHQGYGLPIGGVLATDANTVIPYAVGVDIACRMCLSIFDLPASMTETESKLLKKVLVENTHFGIGSESNRRLDDSLFDRPEWRATKPIRDLRDKAYRQLGTSGTGNHFVEWGELEIFGNDDLLNVPPGKYLALLSHSGSRGFGGGIAGYYSKVAMEKTRLPKEAQHLAWLTLDSEEGQAYWLAMNLAGEYASANHHEIHDKIAKALNQSRLALVENHHNFAWKEKLANGREVMVHRKGATPAGPNDLGIIPGSMTLPGYVVRGKGEGASIHSASHGAGRVMSRSQAFRTLDKKVVRQAIETAGVSLIGGDLDEAPMVYKNIETVMAAQQDLVTILARFLPKIVRMAEGKEKAED